MAYSKKVKLEIVDSAYRLLMKLCKEQSVSKVDAEVLSNVIQLCKHEVSLNKLCEVQRESRKLGLAVVQYNNHFKGDDQAWLESALRSHRSGDMITEEDLTEFVRSGAMYSYDQAREYFLNSKIPNR